MIPSMCTWRWHSYIQLPADHSVMQVEDLSIKLLTTWNLCFYEFDRISKNPNISPTKWKTCFAMFCVFQHPRQEYKYTKWKFSIDLSSKIPLAVFVAAFVQPILELCYNHNPSTVIQLVWSQCWAKHIQTSSNWKLDEGTFVKFWIFKPGNVNERTVARNKLNSTLPALCVTLANVRCATVVPKSAPTVPEGM